MAGISFRRMRVGDQYEVKTGLTPSSDRIVVDGALFLQFAGSQ